MPRVKTDALARALKITADLFGLRVAKSWDDVGALAIDHSAGGFQIEQIVNARGGTTGIGHRQSSQELYDSMLVADGLMEAAMRERGEIR